MTKTLMAAALSAALMSTGAQAEQSADITELKRLIAQMKAQHDQQIRALEAQIERAEQSASAAAAQAEAATQQARAAATQTATRSPTADNSFNPAISLVLQGGYADYSEDPETYHLEGMPLGGEAGLKEAGLALWETELTASASVDNLFYGQTTIGLHSHEGEIEVDIEEAYVDTLALPGGLGLRFGRFYSALGYLNTHHTHAWDFADEPLAYRAFLGGQYRDDGLRLSWLAPLDSLLLELGGEALRGGTYPAAGSTDDLGGAFNLFAKLGGDVGLNNSWQLGLARLNADAEERVAGGHGHGHEHEDEHGGEGPAFSGDSDLTVFDAVWKTRLAGGRMLTLQGEYLLRDEQGQVSLTEEAGDALFDYRGEQSGWYLQSVFQFNPRWRAGLRYDRLHADNRLRMLSNATGEDDDEIFEESGYASDSHRPHRWAAMLDWSPSEFSRVRLQYARDDSRAETDDQIFVQYIMTLGAHGAHQF